MALPSRVGFGRPDEQRRVARRAEDALIDATGGHAILAEELPHLEPELLGAGLRALGEDPAGTLTFLVTAGRGDRVEALGVSGARGSARPVRHYWDYTVQLEVRRADAGAVLGTIETFASTFAKAPELDAAGHPQGVPLAIESAMKKALRAYAPGLTGSEPFPTLLEAPPRAAGEKRGSKAALDKLKKLATLYPDASTDDLAALASGRAQFLVVRPGRLAALGLQRGDLLSGLAGQRLGSRAALARTLARGQRPALSVDRGRGHFLLGQAVVAGRR